jgi:hypothetical protein
LLCQGNAHDLIGGGGVEVSFQIAIHQLDCGVHIAHPNQLQGLIQFLVSVRNKRVVGLSLWHDSQSEKSTHHYALAVQNAKPEEQSKKRLAKS